MLPVEVLFHDEMDFLYDRRDNHQKGIGKGREILTLVSCMGLVGGLFGRIGREKKVRSQIEELKWAFRKSYEGKDFRRAADLFLEVVNADPRMQYFDVKDYLPAGNAFVHLNRVEEALRTWITGFHKCSSDVSASTASLSLLSYNIALTSHRLDLLEPAIVFCRYAIEYSPQTKDGRTDGDMARLWGTLVNESRVRGIDVSSIGRNLALTPMEVEGRGKIWFTTINGRFHTQFALWGDAKNSENG